MLEYLTTYEDNDILSNSLIMKLARSGFLECSAKPKIVLLTTVDFKPKRLRYIHRENPLVAEESYTPYRVTDL